MNKKVICNFSPAVLWICAFQTFAYDDMCHLQCVIIVKSSCHLLPCHMLLPTISPHLFISCCSQCAAQRFLKQEAAGTVSLSGTTTLSNKNVFASTTVAAREMRTDLTPRTPV